MAKDTDTQLSLLADDIDYSGELSRPDWAIDVGDFEGDFREVTKSTPPIQERSLEDVRSILIARARGAMPTVTNNLVTKPHRDESEVTNNLVTKPRRDESEVTNNLVTKPRRDESEVTNNLVTNRPRKHPIANLYHKWVGAYRYWCIRPYVDGERVFFHLDRDYDRAIAKGKKIYTRLAAGDSRAAIDRAIASGEL